jgi:hypothetical protein
MRTKLFWTGPFGLGGATGTGTDTIFCGGVAGLVPIPGGLCCVGESEGGAPFEGGSPFGCGPFCCGCCANDVDETSNVTAIKMGTPFMPESLEDETN